MLWKMQHDTNQQQQQSFPNSNVQEDRHSRIHPVLDELEKAILVLIFGSKSFIHDLFSGVTTKLVGRPNVNISGVRCFFSFQIGCSETERVRR